MPRKPFTMLSASLLLGGAFGLLSLVGCKPDLCKEPEYSRLTQRQRCDNCQPKRGKDDEVLARLNPTQLPWPVRRNIEQCIDQHAGDLFVTKQGLRECIESDSKLDVGTKMAVLELIAKSNVMEQADLENFHAQCSPANLSIIESNAGIRPTAPMVPPSPSPRPLPEMAPPPPAPPPASAVPPPVAVPPRPTPTIGPTTPPPRPMTPPPALTPSSPSRPVNLPPPGGVRPPVNLPPPGGARPAARPPSPPPPPAADPLL